MIGFVSAALATPAFDSDESCERPELLAAVPADGATGLPTDAIVTLILNEDAVPCIFEVTVSDDLGATLVSEVEIARDVVRVTPAGLAPDRTYAVLVRSTEGSLDVQFATTSAKLLPEPTVFAHDLDVGGSCGASFDTSAFGWVDSDAPDTSLAALSMDGVDVAYGLATGQDTLSETVSGVRDACATMRLYDVAGRLVWESAPDCLRDFDCPTPDPVEPTVRIERTCDPAERTQARVRFDLPQLPPGAGGTMFAELVTERETARSAGVPWVPGSDPEVVVSAGGTRDACVTVTYVDVWGEAAWATEAECAEPGEPCGWTDDLDGVRCGCASGRDALLSPLAVLLLLRRRR